MEFNEQDSSELANVVKHMKSNPLAQEQLQSMLKEVSDPEKRAVLEKAWEDDCVNISKRSQFIQDQLNCSELRRTVVAVKMSSCFVVQKLDIAAIDGA